MNAIQADGKAEHARIVHRAVALGHGCLNTISEMTDPLFAMTFMAAKRIAARTISLPSWMAFMAQGAADACR